MEFLKGVTISCFTLSYAIALGLEFARLNFRAKVRQIALLVMALAGIFTHGVYLWNLASEELRTGTPLSSWQDWCLLVALLLALIYVWFAVQRPQGSQGLFLLPLVLSAIAAAWFARNIEPFSTDQAARVWGIIHGVALLLGTVVVALGFAAGVMYLVQSYRMKRKLPPAAGFRLPSLEWLQKACEQSLVASTGLLGIGLLSGLVLNVRRDAGIPWSDPVIWTSGVLLAWLTAAAFFNAFYRPARRGRKIAYLVVASFVFLALELGLVLWQQHAAVSPLSAAPHPGVISAALCKERLA